MLITSIIIYISFAVLLVILAENGRLSESVGHHKNARYSQIATIAVFSIMCGLRFRVGVDCEEYASTYQLLLEGGSMEDSAYFTRSEWGFRALTYLFGFFHLPRLVYMGFLAFIEISLIFLAVRERKYLLPCLYLILILGPFFYELMNGIRQMIAACAMLYAMQCLIDYKDWKKYLIILGLAALVHKSVLVMLPFILLVFYNKLPNKYLCLLLLFLSVMIGQMSLVRNYLIYGQTLLSVIGYSSYSDSMEYLVETESAISHFGPRRIVMLLSNALVIVFSDIIVKRYPKDRFFKVSYLFTLIYSIFSELLISVDLLFMRPLMYCLPFMLICQAYVLNYLTRPFARYSFGIFKIKFSVSCHTIIFVMVLLIFCSYTILANFATYGIPDETEMFKFYFLHQVE